MSKLKISMNEQYSFTLQSSASVYQTFGNKRIKNLKKHFLLSMRKQNSLFDQFVLTLKPDKYDDHQREFQNL